MFYMKNYEIQKCMKKNTTHTSINHVYTQVSASYSNI